MLKLNNGTLVAENLPIGKIKNSKMNKIYNLYRIISIKIKED